MKFIDKFQDWVFMICPNCKYRNFSKYQNCFKCKSVLETKLQEESELWVFLDIERTLGPQSSPPLSIGLVACRPADGHILVSKDIIITPDGLDPTEKDWNSLFKHRMYVKLNSGKKTVFKRGSVGEADRALDSVPPLRAAMEVIDFLEKTGSSNITILFHGPDEESLLPFIRSQGVEGRWEELVCCIVDTQGFFDMLGCQKTGMQSIVKTYGSKADKELFKEEAHSSLVDSLVLASLCTKPGVREEFGGWLTSDWLGLICKRRKLRGRLSDWLVWERN